MEHSPKIFAGATWAAGSSDRVAQVAEHWRLARAAYADLRLMGMPRVNLLFKGPDGATRDLVGILRRDLDEPIVAWAPNERLVLPSAVQGGTLILHEVGGLPQEDQLRVLDWLERTLGRSQVVTTTSECLLGRIQSGAFVETLFYRLNTVSLDLTA